MSGRRIDLHIHTTASDGTDLPAEAVRKAAALGLAAMSVTDHDTVDGVGPALAAGKELGIEVVPGIEVSSDYRDNNVHILGYFIDPAAKALEEVILWVQREREIRNRRIVKMFQDDGFDLSLEELEANYPHAVLGRPHMAEMLTRKGYVSSIKEAFDLYLGEDRPYFLPKQRISIARAVEVILASGGVPVLAHPFQYHYPLREVEEMIEYTRSLGIRAIECYYSLHSPEEQAWLLGRAEALGLGVSGGSDYHGTRKPHIAIGSGTGWMEVPYSVLEGLRALTP